MHERIEAAAHARKLAPSAPLYYVSMPNPWLDMSNYRSAQVLGQHAQACGAKVIVVDNLRDVSGAVDENSGEMGRVMSNFRRLTEDTQAAVIVIHHQRKTNGLSGRAGDTLRGHSSIEAAIDLALLIEREEHADSLTISATKTRGADVYPFGVLFTYEHKPDSTELAEIRFFGVEIEDLSSDAAIRRAILEAVKDLQPVSQTDLLTSVKPTLDVGINRIRSQMAGLVNKGRLSVTTGARNAKLYSVPDDVWHVAASV
jgi:hypothetical protein